jgi:hypothetical protein
MNDSEKISSEGGNVSENCESSMHFPMGFGFVLRSGGNGDRGTESKRFIGLPAMRTPGHGQPRLFQLGALQGKSRTPARFHQESSG